MDRIEDDDDEMNEEIEGLIWLQRGGGGFLLGGNHNFMAECSEVGADITDHGLHIPLDTKPGLHFVQGRIQFPPEFGANPVWTVQITRPSAAALEFYGYTEI